MSHGPGDARWVAWDVPTVLASIVAVGVLLYSLIIAGSPLVGALIVVAIATTLQIWRRGITEGTVLFALLAGIVITALGTGRIGLILLTVLGSIVAYLLWKL